MEWVMAENAKTAAVLDKDPRYPGLFREALAIAEAKDRIPEPSIIGGQILNFWQDADHVRGIWRRTTSANYRKSAPSWTTVLDLDSLSREEKANWFWSGADCEEPAERDCMIGLSDGGEDAVTLREFDLRRRDSSKAAFPAPRQARLGLAGWTTLLVAREWAPASSRAPAIRLS